MKCSKLITCFCPSYDRIMCFPSYIVVVSQNYMVVTTNTMLAVLMQFHVGPASTITRKMFTYISICLNSALRVQSICLLTSKYYSWVQFIYLLYTILQSSHHPLEVQEDKWLGTKKSPILLTSVRSFSILSIPNVSVLLCQKSQLIRFFLVLPVKSVGLLFVLLMHIWFRYINRISKIIKEDQVTPLPPKEAVSRGGFLVHSSL